MRQCILWFIAMSIARHLPLRFSYALAILLADLAYFAWRRGRNCARAAMRRALGDNADSRYVGKLARHSFRNFAICLVDFLRLPLLRPEHLDTKVICQGWENVERAFRENKGLLIVGLHLGNFDLGLAFVQKYFPVNVVARPFRPAKVNNWLQGIRVRLGAKVIYGERMWELSNLLRRKEMVAVLIDSPSKKAKITVKFLGGQCHVTAGPALLALRTGASIVTGYFVRQHNKYHGFFNKPIQYHATGDLREDVQQLTQRIMESLEEGARKYPDQWCLFHPFWASPAELTAVEAGNASSH